ncbi:uncharacterized protein LOC107460145 [Arachis duranensis]|uniref:Uncharacterized protein LOC107460145 n=1 Tax=Arachis duranensis TaxID=130453 RepID=A0A6P4B4V0_ARADU|nr:uncharacterized protein LOC107460145 [Arachis duranensis]
MEAFCQQSSSLLSANKKKQMRIIKTASSSNKRIGGGRVGNHVTPLDNTYAYAAAAAGLLNHPSRANSLVHYQHQQQQPPLLPLPNASSIHNQHQHHQPLLSRSQSLMISSPMKSNKASTKKRSSSEHDNSSHRRGPDPKDLPKHLPLSKVLMMGGNSNKGNMEDMIMSPPPSSLPLPKFSLRSKLSCNAEAAGVDDGATNNLRRLLRLR